MEWLCLTCQMQRALKASESVEAPLMKPQPSPKEKVSTAAADSTQKTDTSTQRAEVPDKSQKVSETPVTLQKPGDTQPPLQTQISNTASVQSQEIPDTVSVPTKEEKTVPPPSGEIMASTALPSKEMAAVVSDPQKSKPSEGSVNTDSNASLQKQKDIPPSSQPTKTESEIKKVEAISLKKSTDRPDSSAEEIKPKQPSNKESIPAKTSPAKTVPSEEQSSKKESGGFSIFGSPKSQHASKTTDAVTGKMMGFGSSLFSSASTLITSAVQESRTTPPSSRKMSAPAQVSRKLSVSPTSPKSSPPVSPKLSSAKEPKLPSSQKPQQEKIQDQPPEAKAPPTGLAKVDMGPSEPAKPTDSQAANKTSQSTCPLCKAGLNVDSTDTPNYKTCTECNTNVCNKCGFSPVPNLREVCT